MTIKLEKQELRLIESFNNLYHLYEGRNIPINAVREFINPKMAISSILFYSRTLRSKGLLEISRIQKHCEYCKEHNLFHFKPKQKIIYLKQKPNYQKIKREKFK